MAQTKQRNKKKPVEIEKIRARFRKKLAENEALSLEDLIAKRESKMSMTDRFALERAISQKSILTKSVEDGSREQPTENTQEVNP